MTIPDLVAAVQRVIELALTEVGGQFQVKFWVSDDRPRFDGGSLLVTHRLSLQEPRAFCGSNRLAFLAAQTLEVFVYARYVADPAGDDTQLATYDDQGFYRTLLRVVDAFQGLNVFSEYDDDWRPNDTNAGLPDDAYPLTIRPCQMTNFTLPYKPKADPGWIAGKVSFDLLLVQPLTI